MNPSHDTQHSTADDLWLEEPARTLQGGRRIALLESVERACSIEQAALLAGLRYHTAIAELDSMNNLSDRPLLIRVTGGSSRGNGYLTEQGRRVIRLYRSIEKAQQRLFRRMEGDFHDFRQLNELLRAITMKTSARNQLRGTITRIQRGAVNADVIVDLGDGVEIFANITNDAVDDLSLAPGREATALIKSSFVLLSPDADIRISARNRLRGTIASIVPGAVNCEVRLQLNGGRIIVAIVTNEGLKELDLAEGSDCTALIKASHVLIAVND
jgi:molybdate transport system regulatory protein